MRVRDEAPGSRGCAGVSKAHDEALRPTAIDRNRPASPIPINDEGNRRCDRSEARPVAQQPFRRREGTMATLRDVMIRQAPPPPHTIKPLANQGASIHDNANSTSSSDPCRPSLCDQVGEQIFGSLPNVVVERQRSPVVLRVQTAAIGGAERPMRSREARSQGQGGPRAAWSPYSRNRSPPRPSRPRHVSWAPILSASAFATIVGYRLQPRKPSFRWIPGRSYTNFQTGSLKWG